jgi:hypothetical protein
MSLIVEDGTGKADAESYVSVVEANAYHTKRGNAAWADLDTPVKEQYLRQASDYLAQNYATLWKGSRLTTFQALDWPRWNVMRPDITPYLTLDPNVIPTAIKSASCELALRCINGALSPDLTTQVVKEAIGPISVEYLPGARQTPRYEAIERLLDPFLQASGGARLVRG